MTVKGSIDIIDNTQVCGWVADDASSSPRFVRILVDGVEIGAALADHFRQDLKDLKISDGRSGFRFVFARFLDPFVEHDVRIEDRDTCAHVGQGNVRLPSLLGASAESTFLALDRDYVVLNVGEASLRDGVWTLELRAVGPAAFDFGIHSRGAHIDAFKVSPREHPVLAKLGLKLSILQTTLTPDPGAPYALAMAIEDSALVKRFKPVCSIAFPAKMPDYISPMTIENMSRVVGPNTTIERFAVGGFNTAYRLNELLKAHFGREFRDLRTCLDWGVGPGRVALPLKHFLAPELKLVGVDVDPFNVEFGQRNYPELEFQLSRFLPPLPFADETFDAIYGISVFTHLTEATQFAWLEELRRVVKPGSPVIVTAHSELSLLDVARARYEIFAEISKFGISDSTMDGNLGPKLAAPTYYRATFHGRKYILNNWTKYFDILECYTGGNAEPQDFIVMRAK